MLPSSGCKPERTIDGRRQAHESDAVVRIDAGALPCRMPGRGRCLYVKTDDDRVVGMHIVSPNAGEIMQGFGVAVKLGCTFEDLQETVGIHPTIAESFTTLEVTKSSGEAADAGGC